MRNPVQLLIAWCRDGWPEKWPTTPDSLAHRFPNFYLILVTVLTFVGLALSLGFPLTALVLLSQLPAVAAEIRGTTDWAMLLLHLGIMLGTGAMTVFLWRQEMRSPSGRPLNATERQPLDALLESLRAETRLARPYEVRVTRGHQLESVCVPRNGFAVFCRRTLLLGLPSLQAMPASHTEAAIRRVLSRPNTLRGWVLHAVACQQACSIRYHAAYRAQRSVAARIMTALFTVYLTVCRRLCTPAVRWNELEQDTVLNQQVSIDTVLQLLAADALLGRYLEEKFWPAIREEAKRAAKPPRPHALFRSMLRKQLTGRLINRWLADAVNEPPNEHAARPTMSERLANLGSKRLEPVSLGTDSAAEALLRDSIGSIVTHMDRKWRLKVRQRWHMEYAKHAANQARLATLRQRAQAGNIQGRDAVLFAKLARHYLAPADALPIYRQIAGMNPHDARILAGIGRLLSAYHLPDGAALLKRAVRLDGRTKAGADEPSTRSSDARREVVDVASAAVTMGQ